MTREKAIKYAEDKVVRLQLNMDRPESMYGDYVICSSELEFVSAALRALHSQADVLTNVPLTLEQLLEMDGEPVYSPRLQEWGLVAAGGFTVTNMVYICDKAGNLRPATVWLACGPVYRCKPEEQPC